MSQVQITSGGDYTKTLVLIDGQPVEGVVDVQWSCKTGEFATATVTFENVAAIVTGETKP